MKQTYLDIARSYINGTAALPLPAEPSARSITEPEHADGYDVNEPIPLAAYRDHGNVRRCRSCGHPLSVIAVGEKCGRCVGPKDSLVERTWPEEALLRGKVLAALDRRGYPRIAVTDGHAGPGLLLWAPVLRELNAEGLSALLGVVTNMQTPAQSQAEEDADALPW